MLVSLGAPEVTWGVRQACEPHQASRAYLHMRICMLLLTLCHLCILCWLLVLCVCCVGVCILCLLCVGVEAMKLRG